MHDPFKERHEMFSVRPIGEINQIKHKVSEVLKEHNLFLDLNSVRASVASGNNF